MTAANKAQPEERERQQKALDLRRLGATYPQIAAELGYADHSGAYRAVEAVLKRVESEGAAELRKLEDNRLDIALRKVMPGVLAGDLKAIDMFVKLHDRRVKLHGLAAPEKLIVAQAGPSAEEFATSLAQDFAELGIEMGPPAPIEGDIDGERWANT